MDPKIVPIKVQEKAKIVLAFLLKLLYTKQVASAKETWSIGQAVKTSPSHGENRGSIPLSTAGKLLEIQKLFLCNRKFLWNSLLHKKPPGDAHSAQW